MHVKKISSTLIFLFALVVILLSSCQKDPEVLTPAVKPQTDSLSIISGGNLLASTGTLTVKFKDSAYVFDASTDSIAFVQVNTGGKEKYFGITAINKAHNLSFGISSRGAAANNLKAGVAGSQLLLKTPGDDLFLPYSLSGISANKASSSFNIIQYKTGKILAKGTFTVFLSPENKLAPELYKADGSFDLRLN